MKSLPAYFPMGKIWYMKIFLFMYIFVSLNSTNLTKIVHLATLCLLFHFGFFFFARYSIHNSGISFSVKKVSYWFIGDGYVL